MKIHQVLLFILGLLIVSCQADLPKDENSSSEIKEELPQKVIKDTTKNISAEIDSVEIDSSTKVTKAERPSLSPAEMQFDSLTFDYGIIQSGAVITHDFKFVNIGDRPLEINNVIGSCGCTAASFNFLPFPKGDTGVIKARFDSKGKIGKQENTLTVKSNHKDGDIILKIKGVVKDSINFKKQ